MKKAERPICKARGLAEQALEHSEHTECQPCIRWVWPCNSGVEGGGGWLRFRIQKTIGVPVCSGRSIDVAQIILTDADCCRLETRQKRRETEAACHSTQGGG